MFPSKMEGQDETMTNNKAKNLNVLLKNGTFLKMEGQDDTMSNNKAKNLKIPLKNGSFL